MIKEMGRMVHNERKLQCTHIYMHVCVCICVSKHVVY